MPATSSPVEVPSDALFALDALVARGQYRDRAEAVKAAVDSLLLWQAQRLLLQEYAKLDPREEVALAEEGLQRDRECWPPY